MAKRRIGEAAWSTNDQRVLPRARSAFMWRARREGRGRQARLHAEASSAGFTLIELVIVTAILPIVIGALAVGIISVFSLQSSVSNRLTDSADAQVTSIDFDRDVQSAILLTTSSTPSSPGQCGTGFEVLGLQLGNSTEVSYSAAQNGTSYVLSRNLCTLNGGNPTLQTSVVVGRDLPASILNAATPTTTNAASFPVSIPQCLQTPTPQIDACGVVGTSFAYQTSWVGALGITGVSFSTTEPGSKYSYQLTAVPNAAVGTASLPPLTPGVGGGFAVPGTGTYSKSLFFVNFANWNTQTKASGVSCTGSALPMAAPIANSPDTLSFCLSVSATGNKGAITGNTTGPGTACGVAANSGYNDIAAVPLPTYSCPPTSEAFLGNNGFYTGVQGDPALYTEASPSTAVLTFTNIQVLSAAGLPATGWNLVTGDAESTDPGESITWQSTPSTSVFTLIPNSVNASTGAVISDIGNACNGAPPTNLGTLTGLGTTKVECTASYSRDKTGTPMLEVTTPQSLTMTLVGSGLQAVFLGILLS